MKMIFHFWELKEKKKKNGTKMKISQKYKDTNIIYTFNKKEELKSMNFVLASPTVSACQFSKQVVHNSYLVHKVPTFLRT